MAAEQQQPSAECELLGQSMLRMIRSARHRLQRDASAGPGSCHGGNNGGGGFGSEARARGEQVGSRGPPGHARPSRMRSNVDPLILSRGSENAGPTPSLQPSSAPRSERPPVLGDVTNLGNHSRAGLQQCQRAPLGDVICPKPPAAELVPPAAPPPTAPAPAAAAPPLPPHRDVDVDKAHAEDPQHVAEYAADIYWRLQQHEGQQQPEPFYMERQPQVTSRMRAILVDWLVDVHKKYKLRPQTLYLAIGILDRFLEKRNTLRRHLQLVGVTALLVAAKFEELFPPQIADFVYVTDKAYSKEEVMRMEVSILTVLEFRVCTPTAVNFLDRYQAVNGCGDTHRELAQYLLELTLVDNRMLKHAPSHLAAAAVLLSNKLLKRQPAWTPAAVKHTKMTEQMLRECGREICALLEQAETNPLQAVRKKYSQAKHHAVAKMSFAGLPPALPPPPPPSTAAPGRPQVAAGEEAAGTPRATQPAGAAPQRGGPTSCPASTETPASSEPPRGEALGSWSPVETVSV